METRLLRLTEENDLEALRKELQSDKVSLDRRYESGDSVLHVACRTGSLPCVKLFIEKAARLDLANSKGQTPLHVALLAGHSHIATELIKAGAFTDAQNLDGDAAIHIACRKGMLSVVEELCQKGCSLDILNNQEYFPLYIAAKHGHVDVLRCLILNGCNIEQRTPYGIQAEITAFKHYQSEAGDLLYKLRNATHCDTLKRQLKIECVTFPKICVKFIGPPSSGKTTLVRSLKAGYFIGLFSRSRSQQSSNGSFGKSSPPSPKKSWNEMEMTAHTSLIPFNFDYPHYDYTKGIEIHNTNFGSSEVSLWDFSGFETYYQTYHLFLGETSGIYVLTVNLSESSTLQHYYSSYWLNFLLARFRPRCSAYKFKVLLVGTHADKARIFRDAQGAFQSPLAQELRDKLALEFSNIEFSDKMFLVDAHLANSQGIREVKTAILDSKAVLLQNMTKTTQFVESIFEVLPTWKKELEIFPAITCSEFLSRVRKVNPLAMTAHLRSVLEHLEIIGEVIFLEVDELVVLDPHWFCCNIIGEMLSLESIARARLTGCYTEEDFQGAFPQAPAELLLPLLVAINLCTKCDNEGEIEYELPCLNLMEKLDGLWAADDERYSDPNSCYGGVRLKAACKLFSILFPRFQVQLRRAAVSYQDPESDLYQWFHGSKLCSGDIEALITLEQEGQVIDIKIRGTNLLRLACFYFLEEILAIIEQVVLSTTPGCYFERHILSSEDLKSHCETPYCWKPEDMFSGVLLKTGLETVFFNPDSGKHELLRDLVAFGSSEVENLIILGGNLHVKELFPGILNGLSRLLDPADSLGRDWCLLAVKLGLENRIAALESDFFFSKTIGLIEFWSKNLDSTIEILIEKLLDCGRNDAVELLKQSAPLYRINSTT